MDDRTLVTFSENPVSLLNAYADSGEGIDRAGGFALQVDKTIDGGFHQSLIIEPGPGRDAHPQDRRGFSQRCRLPSGNFFQEFGISV